MVPISGALQHLITLFRETILDITEPDLCVHPCAARASLTSARSSLNVKLGHRRVRESP